MSVFLRHVEGRTTSVISFVALLVFLPLFIVVVQQTVVLFTRASGVPANIIVDAQSRLEPVKTDFYHAFAQGGEESTDMLSSVSGDVKALSPKLIRIDHLYDHYQVVGRDGGGLTYDFSKLDAVINTIVATGAKPVLALSYMPQVIAKDGNIINPPNDWNEWAQVVQKTIEHYSGKNGRNISGIYYEVWNEPDLAQFGGWKMGGEKSYLTLYRYAAEGASQAQNVNQFYLGGPSTTGLYENWITGLVKSGSRLDFFAWHTYLANPERYASDQRNIVKWLLPFPTYTLRPKLITEFGFTGEKNVGYNGMYAAAHTAAVIRQLITGGPSYIFSFQIKDGPGQSSGNGWGIITHEDNGTRKKPRYYVYSFIDQMAGTRMNLTGEGSWVTGFASFRDNIIRIMLVNFNPNGDHSEQVPITVTNVSPGTYTVKTKFLLAKESTSTETVTNNSLTTKVFMSTQSVAILEIAKK